MLINVVIIPVTLFCCTGFKSRSMSRSMRNDYDAAKDLCNYYVHCPVAVGRLILLQCDGGEMTMMRNDCDVRRLIQMRRRTVLW